MSETESFETAVWPCGVYYLMSSCKLEVVQFSPNSCKSDITVIYQDVEQIYLCVVITNLNLGDTTKSEIVVCSVPSELDKVSIQHRFQIHRDFPAEHSRRTDGGVVGHSCVHFWILIAKESRLKWFAEAAIQVQFSAQDCSGLHPVQSKKPVCFMSEKPLHCLQSQAGYLVLHFSITLQYIIPECLAIHCIAVLYNVHPK